MIASIYVRKGVVAELNLCVCVRVPARKPARAR
jgi:hypothetical protein